MATQQSRKKQKQKKSATRISITRKPDHLTDVQWQSALRRQIAADEKFVIRGQEKDIVYSDYDVYSQQSKLTYKVALRSADNSLNFCSCPDFKTNQLGTCKHIEAVLLKINAKPAARKLLKIPYASRYTSVYLSYVGARKVRMRIGTEKPAEYKKLAKEYFTTSGELSDNGFKNFDMLLTKAKALDENFRCYPDALEFVLRERDFFHRKSTARNLGVQLLAGTNKATLFPYQQQGVLFAAAAGRCILADDMGLGKTLQAIVSAEVMRKHFHTGKTIIVCPTSLKYQWKSEIKKFVGEKNVTVIEGNLLNRMKQYQTEAYEYLIVSYNVAGNDYEYLNELQADILILDEAQRIKNWRSKISAKMKRIKTTHAFVLTGTPVENNIEELYSLMQIVNPYLLGSRHHFLQNHQITDEETGKVTGYKNLNAIGTLLQDVMLRRTKKEVLKQLPSRMDKNLIVPITDEQMQIHTEYADIVARLVHKWRRMGFLKEEDRQRLLNNLSMMRMVCDSTYIINQTTNFQTKLDEVSNILEEVIAMEGEKIVIFSQWERMTRLVAAMLEERNIGFKYLHGGVPAKDREELFVTFNTDPGCRVFLSTDAGGVGLNLQTAAYLINIDIPWNPAVLEQRIGRIYRLGQKKNVNIINLVAKGTIEEKMLSVLKFKKGVADGILDGGDNDIFMGDDKFKKFMESVESVAVGANEEAGEKTTLTKEEIQEEKLIETPVITYQNSIETTEDTAEEQSVLRTDNIEAPHAKRLIEEGVSFFEHFMQSVSSPDGVKKLTEQLIDTDEKTGQSYLKIPVSNSNVVENALSMLGAFLKGMK
ncbi:MAG: DEAD/DEAH box helicase [Chitinophagaceae bacterium]|nr:DEAD/DEAH box helicase [Chitinophagaceae bacterium]